MGKKFGSRKRSKVIKTTDDSSTYTKSRKLGQGCCIACPPYRGENAPKTKKNPKPDKHKNKNRESIRKGAIEKVRRQLSPEQF